MNKIALFIFIILAGFTSCKCVKKNSRMKQQNESVAWINPVIEPRIHQGIEAIFAKNQDVGANEMNGAGLTEFCNRMNIFFANSNLTHQEAEFLYELLYESGLFFNEPTGMPDPEQVIAKETVDDLKARIAIKKNADLGYSLFVMKTGCGYTYYFGQFVIPEKGQKLNFIPSEVWRASMPC